MIVLVDNEHATGYAKPWGERIMAARVRIKYELEDMAGVPCLVVRYSHVTPELLRDIDARAVFISGNSATANEYSAEEQAGLFAAIRERAWPVFGFCGGHQVMGQALGAPLEPIGALDDGEEAFGEAADFAPGMKHELGYFPINVIRDHHLLEGLGSEPIVRHAHSWELKALPDGFTNYASTELTPIQLMVHDELPMVGTQFHPEYATEEHPAGRRLIQNFMNWAGVT
ncbi:MAG: gamma-glutamyl-gamma-aminobutyrate hydrolase family protein [Acidimicrobiia bacterium]|nr:gamma-glutamyl-gamma-aminobutyrate hydrolase family protein [Acidimicrobiia bacterium]